MKIGVDYYPEQWDRSLWEKDVAMMKDAGVKVVRMGEFAWSRLEPKEGKYDFGWLDEVIGMFDKAGIEVFLGTPTNTPPLWLYEGHPEVLQVGKDGNRVPIGIRGHRCLNSPVYREFCKKIIKKMVSRYKNKKCVIGYQIDNELEANHCCCPVCQQEFRKYVKEKYKSIDQVNKAYGNSVWSGEYSDFSQINPPFGFHQTWLNPSYMLDFNRYASKSTVDYVEFQRRLIHETDSKALITTNNWLCENMPDFYDLFDKLDFVSYDNYPATSLPENQETLYSHAFHLDLMRGIKKKNFWIMEQLSGALGSWAPMSPTLQPGMLKGYSLQAIAHGADAVVHFRWRTAVSGAEMFWHGLIDQSNVPGRRFEEFQDLCRTVDGWQELEGSTPESQVAIIYGSDQEYAFKIQPQVEGKHYFTQLKAYHDAFASLGIGVDIVDIRSDLGKYKVVVAPTLFVTDKGMADKLDAYARQGGRLVLTNRSGVKDENNQCIMSPLPTVFADMAGVHVEEYDAIGKKWQKLHISQASWLLQDKRMTAARQGEEPACQLWCDILESHGAEVLARYGENFYEGKAAITVNQYGDGEVYYVGTVMNRWGMVSLMSEIIRKAGISHIESLPFGVEHTVRRSQNNRWHFLFNNTGAEQEFEMRWRLPAGMRNDYDETICLQPFEMKMWKEED